MGFNEFLDKQDEVYSRFRDTSKIHNEGTKPAVPERQGGYLIVFRHSQEIAQKISDFSKRISQAIPSLFYDFATIHTTISDLIMGENFTPEKDTLEKLCASVVVAKIVNKPQILYSEWLYNQNTVLAAGIPDQPFFDIIQDVYSLGKQKGLSVRLPWGAHITVSRFLEERKPEELDDFVKLMKEAPILGESTPENIDVGYFDFGRNGFKIETYERFKL